MVKYRQLTPEEKEISNLNLLKLKDEIKFLELKKQYCDYMIQKGLKFKKEQAINETLIKMKEDISDNEKDFNQFMIDVGFNYNYYRMLRDTQEAMKECKNTILQYNSIIDITKQQLKKGVEIKENNNNSEENK